MLQKPRNEVRSVEIGGELAAIGDLACNIDAHTVGQDQEILQCSAVSWVGICNVGIVGIEPTLFHEPAFIDAVLEKGKGAGPVETGDLHAKDIPVSDIFGMHHAWPVFFSSP